MTVLPLTRRGASGAHAHRVHIAASRRTPPAELPVHAGQDWIYVLDGRLRLLLGDADLVLSAGEAAEFTTWTPHWFGAVEEPVDLILIVGPEGADVHLHD
jgi:quercetin dioxygenase-like cupin family protein